MRGRIISGIVAPFLFASMLFSANHFTETCQGLKNWQFLDMKGDGKARLVEDSSVPPGYGPMVIEMSGTNVMLFARNEPMSDGTIVVLWKDVDPNHADSDGIILFRADYPNDLSEIHNLKTNRPQYWFEQDFDSGILIRYRDEKDEEFTLTQRPGVGLVYDTAWNLTGWFWQKIQCKGETIRAKYWSVVEPEPQHWILSTKHRGRLSGRFGVRAWSAQARIAYFEASSEDISVPVPRAYLHTEHPVAFDEQPVSFKLFTHLPDADPNATLKLTMLAGKKTLSEHTVKFNLKDGMQSCTIPLMKMNDPRAKDIPAFWTKAKREGLHTFNARISSAEGDIIAEAARKLEFRSMDDLKVRFAKLETARKAVTSKIDGVRPEDPTWQPKRIAAETANSMEELARMRLANRDRDGASETLDLAENALVNSSRYPSAYIDASNFKLRADGIRIEPESWQQGDTATITIDWKLTGKRPSGHFSAELMLVDRYNKTITTDVRELSFPSNENKFVQSFQIIVPADFDGKPEKPIEMPKVFSGEHSLTLRVFDQKKNKRQPNRWLLLDNPSQQEFFPVGRHYLLRKVNISGSKVQIAKIDLPQPRVLSSDSISVQLRNGHYYPETIQCALQIRTSAGTIIHEDVQAVKLSGRDSAHCHFPWRINYVGELTATIKIVQHGQVKTHATRKLEIPWPNDFHVELQRSNHVDSFDDDYSVPLRISATQHTATASPRTVRINAYVEGTEYADETKILSTRAGTEEWLISLWPHWGYYRIAGRVTQGEAEFQFEKRMVATVVETRGMEILVNGEPFLVKGLNVHSMYSQSRSHTAQAMKILKAHGFNTLRGDYPPRWEIEMAHAHNLTWMLLAEFSCASTDTIFARYETRPLNAVQEIARQYVLANCELAGALLWNSCNEITDRLDEFLLHLYPVFKTYDPYQRPVNYANLYGQDNWHGQDIMGVNYYFGTGENALARMPLIERSIQVAREHKEPIIFTEYNSWWGPVERTGAEAVEILWNENLKNGMSGGTLYKMTDVAGKHPGLIDQQQNLRIRQEMSQALIRFHADAEVKIKERQGRQLTLNIKNKREFHLRQISLKVTIRSEEREFQLGTDIVPKTSVATAMLLPPELADQSFSLMGELSFETHFGLKNTIPIELFVE